MYRYYSTQRPVSIGTHPKEPDNRPVEIRNFDERTWIDSGGFWAWGYVDYAGPLTGREIEEYELREGVYG